MTTLWQDVRYGLRMVAKSPGFTVVVLLILAVGIGANTAVFSVVNAFLFKPLPYDHAEELVALYEKSPRQGFFCNSVSGPKYLAWRAGNQVFQEMGALSVRNGTLVGTGEASSAVICEVTPSCMKVFRFRTRLGRLFVEDEDQRGKDQVIILSHQFWQSRFGGREDILGQSVVLDDRHYVVVGVLAAGGLANWEGGDVAFTPLPAERLSYNPEAHYYQVFGRLKPGVTLALCRSQMESLTTQINQEETRFGDWMPDMVSFREDNLGNWPGLQTVLLLQGAVAAVLLLACFNAACLLLVRGIGRKRELAIRLAMGATRWQVIRRLLFESILLAIAGGLLGLLFSYWAVQGAKYWLGMQNIILWTDVQTNRAVLVFSIVLSTVAGFISGIVPAWQTTKLDLQSTLKPTAGSISGGHHRTLNAMAVAQITISFVLLVSAGLFMRNLLRLRGVPTGYDPRNLLVLETSVPWRHLDGASPDQFIESSLDHLRTLPGVRSVAAADTLVNYGAIYNFWVEGRKPDVSGPLNQTQLRRISPCYFNAMGLTLFRGRDFTSADRRGSEPVAIINETLAERFFPGEDPIGAHVQTGEGIENRYTVIGVSIAERLGGPAGRLEPMVYVPSLQGWPRLDSYPLAVAVRTERHSPELKKTIEQEIHALDPGVVVTVREMEPWMEVTLLSQKLSSFVFVVFALTALLLSTLGIYSVIAHLVSRRTGEFGIRMALGAQQGGIVRLVLGRGLRITLMGTSLGLVGSVLLTRVLEHFLIDFNPRDLITFGCVTLLSFVVAILACCVPARRAAKVDPMVALRCE
ncbi:MAG: ABC transporter permease [Phycisphaerales bacterium]